jgi:hypothetical protein
MFSRQSIYFTLSAALCLFLAVSAPAQWPIPPSPYGQGWVGAEVWKSRVPYTADTYTYTYTPVIFDFEYNRAYIDRLYGLRSVTPNKWFPDSFRLQRSEDISELTLDCSISGSSPNRKMVCSGSDHYNNNVFQYILREFRIHGVSTVPWRPDFEFCLRGPMDSESENFSYPCPECVCPECVCPECEECVCPECVCPECVCPEPPPPPAARMDWAGSVREAKGIQNREGILGLLNGSAAQLTDSESSLTIAGFGGSSSELDADALLRHLGLTKEELSMGNLIAFEHIGRIDEAFESGTWLFSGAGRKIRVDFDARRLSSEVVAHGAVRESIFEDLEAAPEDAFSGHIAYVLFAVPDDIISDSAFGVQVLSGKSRGTPEIDAVSILGLPEDWECNCPVCEDCPAPEPCPDCPECKPCPDCPECKPCPECEACPEPTPCPACPPCPDVPAPPPSPADWKSVIQSGQTFYVSLDEPAAGNSWMGSLKANETYTVVYTRSTNTFRATGDARDGRTNRTGQYRNANLDNQEISVWGRLFTFDNAGQVFDKEYGVLVGHLSEYPVTPNSDSLSSALANPGAEEGTRYWEISAAIVAKTEHATLGPQSGKYFFSTTGKAAASAKMQQEIDISGCRVLTLSGYFATDSSDQARVTIALFDAAGKPTKTALVRDLGISRARWKVFEIQESAPSNSAVAKITLEGIKGPSGGQTDVHFDGMSVSCSK